ncbi:MAG TPA: BamA/TamA family outer membrane protein [Gemmatimonadaceae bacterium]|nr:BamA/TamA family outer membrane protein [Gemmatimonadaceae bacterium]
MGKASAQQQSGETARAVPGAEYKAGGLKRLVLGKGWRDLWTTEVRAPLFKLDTYAGGVKILERGGGKQTLSLHFVEKDGWKEYQFRSVNKFPIAQAMPPALRGTLSGKIVQDQVSHLMPAAPLLLHPLLKAIGALHVEPELRIMANDPRLGIYQDSFANLLGTAELSPQEAPNNEPGFAGSREIVSGDKFLDIVEKSRDDRVDERDLLANRLVDFLINDNDRTTDNVRFARFGEKGSSVWRVIPRDRDRAFTDNGGLLINYVLRPVYPKYINFKEQYQLASLTFSTHDIDRRLLQRLTRSDFDEVARRVQTSITNDVIEQVVTALPREWRDKTAEDDRLRSLLRVRRDHIPDIAREFYDWLATEVDVHGTDQDEVAQIERMSDGSVTVTLAGKADTTSREPFSRRTFFPAETKEVRLYLHGGDDEAAVRGVSSGAITVRIIGGGGDDALSDSTGGDGVRFYDFEGENKFAPAARTRLNLEPWRAPKQGEGVRFDAPWRPDWGGSRGWGPTVGHAYGAGLIVGFGPRAMTYGFRRLPYRWKASANLMYALANQRGGVNAEVDYRGENSPLELNFKARATRFEAFSFRGFGNDAPDLSDERALVNRDMIVIEPSLLWLIGFRSREGLEDALRINDRALPGLRSLSGKLEAGPALYWTRTHESPSSPLAQAAGVNDGGKGRIGARVGLDVERTTAEVIPKKGWRLKTQVISYPTSWDVEKPFNTASITSAAYLPVTNGMNLAFRLGGATATGDFPIVHSPAIGGQETVRGYAWRRYAGDETAFGSAEVRVPMGVLPFLIRWNVGVFGLADAGRVWLDQVSEGDWHTSVGGGVWFSTLGQTFSLAYAHGEEGRIYLQKGVSF